MKLKQRDPALAAICGGMLAIAVGKNIHNSVLIYVFNAIGAMTFLGLAGLAVRARLKSKSEDGSKQ